MHILSLARSGLIKANVCEEQFSACVFISNKSGQNIFHMSDASLMMKKGRVVVICRSREELMQTWWWGLRVKILYMLKTLEVSD